MAKRYEKVMQLLREQRDCEERAYNHTSAHLRVNGEFGYAATRLSSLIVEAEKIADE